MGIITISREFGSGGHEIAQILSEKLNVNLYDRKMLDEIAIEKNPKYGSNACKIRV